MAEGKEKMKNTTTTTTTTTSITQKDLFKAGFSRVPEEDRRASGTTFRAYRARFSDVLLYIWRGNNRNHYFISCGYEYINNQKYSDLINYKFKDNKNFYDLQYKLQGNRFNKSDLRAIYYELNDVNREFEIFKYKNFNK